MNSFLIAVFAVLVLAFLGIACIFTIIANMERK